MLLAIDIGSSSVEAALLEGAAIAGHAPSVRYETDYDGERAEVPVERIEAAIREAVGRLDLGNVTAVGLIGMAPAWLAMDERGNALTPLVTHQDRRSLAHARRIEATIGRERHLQLAGNRPTPGGISSTTAAWFAEHTDVIARAAVLGHLPTYLIHRLTGEWTMDPGNAGFTGLMDVSTLAWSDELCAAAAVPPSKLPPIIELRCHGSHAVRGGRPVQSTSSADTGLPHQNACDPWHQSRTLLTTSNNLAIPAGLPLIGGLVDGSGAMLLAGAAPGTLVHSVGSTDVLALCLDRPMPREGLLCRPLGASTQPRHGVTQAHLWISAATLAAGGSSLSWARDLLFHGASDDQRDDLLRAAIGRDSRGVRFDPHLAGDRQQVDQPTAAFTGLTLSTTREDLLAAVVQALADDCGQRIRRLLDLAEEAGVSVNRRVLVTGKLGTVLDEVIHSHWPGAWEFIHEDAATVRGLGCL